MGVGPARGDQGNKYLSSSLQPLILYQYLPLAQSNQKPMSKKSRVEASCREQLLRDPEQGKEGGSGPGGMCRDYSALQEWGHFRRFIHEDWRSLEGGRFGILLPGWDLNYYAGRRAKVIQLLPTPSTPPYPQFFGINPEGNTREGEKRNIKPNIMLI